MPRAIAHSTYKHFAEKYRIPIKTPSGKHRSMATLQQLIYSHEKSHPKIKKGLYFH